MPSKETIREFGSTLSPRMLAVSDGSCPQKRRLCSLTHQTGPPTNQPFMPPIFFLCLRVKPP